MQIAHVGKVGYSETLNDTQLAWEERFCLVNLLPKRDSESLELSRPVSIV